MANPSWSVENKERFHLLLPGKRLAFGSVNNEPAITFTERIGKADIIIGYNKTHNYYLACRAGRFEEKKSVSFAKLNEEMCGIKIKKLKRDSDGTRVVYIPDTTKTIEEFCNYWHEYLK